MIDHVRRISRFAIAAVLPVIAAGQAPALACSVCFGDPDSPMVQGAMMGVWFMLGIVASVQIGFGAFFFVYLRRRARIYKNGSLKPVFEVVQGQVRRHEDKE